MEFVVILGVPILKNMKHLEELMPMALLPIPTKPVKRSKLKYKSLLTIRDTLNLNYVSIMMSRTIRLKHVLMSKYHSGTIQGPRIRGK